MKFVNDVQNFNNFHNILSLLLHNPVARPKVRVAIVERAESHMRYGLEAAYAIFGDVF